MTLYSTYRLILLFGKDYYYLFLAYSDTPLYENQPRDTTRRVIIAYDSVFCKRSKPRNKWDYPRSEGFQVDTNGIPVMGNMTLRRGYKVDRFGDEYGKFVAAADAPFAQLALPPDALNVCKPTDDSQHDPLCDPSKKEYPWQYHVYEVNHETLSVLGGPIAPGFGQPGGGIQFFLGGRMVSDLVKVGSLKPISLSSVVVSNGAEEKCGVKPLECTCTARPTKA